MEEIIALYQQTATDADVVIVEGLVPDRSEPYTAKLNAEGVSLYEQGKLVEAIAVFDQVFRQPHSRSGDMNVAGGYVLFIDSPLQSVCKELASLRCPVG